jgi:hypothetical protein
MLKDKSPRNLGEAQEQAAKIEVNLLSSEVEPFHVPRAKVETKPRTMHSVEPTQDINAPWSQKIETLLMNKVTNMERI